MPQKVLIKLANQPDFQTLHAILQNGISNIELKYLLDFDNYIKHIKTILITVSNSFLFGNNDEYNISEFCYKGTSYPSFQAIGKVDAVKTQLENLIEQALSETFVQITNCLNNTNRYQEMKFKQFYEEIASGSRLKYMSFFIEVDNDITDLPSEIKVLPLIVKPNDDVYSFDCKFDTIFICINGQGEDAIVGRAKIKNGFDTNEFYRIFEVQPCNYIEYQNYIDTFLQNYNKITYNIYAMEGEAVFVPVDITGD